MGLDLSSLYWKFDTKTLLTCLDCLTIHKCTCFQPQDEILSKDIGGNSTPMMSLFNSLLFFFLQEFMFGSSLAINSQLEQHVTC